QDIFASSPEFFLSGIRSLAIAGQNIYVCGLFRPIGFPIVAASGLGNSMLARLDKTTGETLAVWNTGLQPGNPSDDYYVSALLEANGDLFVGGRFTHFGNFVRFGLAYLAVPDAPSIVQESETSVIVTRNRTDGSEVTGFRITNISGGALFLKDEVTPIREGDFITVAQGSAGLRFFAVGTNASMAAVSALNDSVATAGTTASTLYVGVPQRPVFRFDRVNYSVNEGGGFVVVSVRKMGA